MKNNLLLVLVLSIGFASAAFAQDRTTTGSIGGRVIDANGLIVPGAQVTISGPEGGRTVTANAEAIYTVSSLIPGRYKVSATAPNFKTTVVTDVPVDVGKESTIELRLQPGEVSATVNVTESAAIDKASTAVSSDLSDELFQNIPVARGVTSLFYLAPGATDSLGGGTANPSISGGSPLDNLYIADGVNITDSAFGGLGTFSRSYGSLGTGINTAYIKEVQVKTGGFEPQYGQSEGGIVNIITKSGSNEYHGALYGYAQPKAFEATRKQPDDFNTNKFGKILSRENYDVGADVGGYVPGLKNKMFFFGSFNPSVHRDIGLGATGSGIRTILGENAQRTRTLNYALKLDYTLNASNSINFSIFGDPSKTNKAAFDTLNIDNTTANSILDFGTRNTAIRYNGAFGAKSPLTIQASFSQGKNHFTESGFDNFNQITDYTQPARGNFVAIGRGAIEPTRGTTYRTSIDLSKQVEIRKWHLGTHTFGIGYQFQRGSYAGTRDRSGPHFTVPATNALGTPLAMLTGKAALAIGQPLNATFALYDATGQGCTLCPLMTINGVDTPVVLQQVRGEFGNPVFDTYNKYNAFYGQDTWRVNKYITALIGLRSEQERIVGNPGSTGKRVAYSFTDQWAPRIGITVDPLGKGKSKVFYNYGRFFEYLPLDLAERSLSTENDFTGARFRPDFFVDSTGLKRVVINQFGTVNPIIDAAHLITTIGGVGGEGGNGITISAQDPSNPILPGTKLGFADEHIIGFEQQLGKGFVLSIRYADRRLKRIIEDAAVVAPEAASFFGQTYFIGNINSKLDAAVNPISHVFTPAFDAMGNITNAPGICDPGLVTAVKDNFGKLLGAVCYEANGKNGKPAGSSGADGVPDGFVDPVHKYRAVEIELNKRFSNNVQLFTNFRIARVVGNYEGHFRNDNGQTDPGISSLFDFTQGDFNLLGDQFKPGPLNTDRRFVSNIYGSYLFGKGRMGEFGSALKGFNLGVGLHMESGVPYSKFGAHPVYLNSGEVPIGGRGTLGRSPFFTQLDLHTDYPWHISERIKLSFVADFFNVFNTQSVRLIDQNFETIAGQLNTDFTHPLGSPLGSGFHLPFHMRVGIRFEF